VIKSSKEGLLTYTIRVWKTTRGTRWWVTWYTQICSS